MSFELSETLVLGIALNSFLIAHPVQGCLNLILSNNSYFLFELMSINILRFLFSVLQEIIRGRSYF